MHVIGEAGTMDDALPIRFFPCARCHRSRRAHGQSKRHRPVPGRPSHQSRSAGTHPERELGELTLANAIEAGASGYLLRDSETTDLPQAIRTVVKGQLVFDTTMADAVVRTLRPRTAPARSGLTAQERKILEFVAHGLTNKGIASTLYLSPHTVKDFLSSILAKLQAKHRAEAVLLANRDHLI